MKIYYLNLRKDLIYFINSLLINVSNTDDFMGAGGNELSSCRISGQ